jgi:prefoldin subunit 5
MNMKNRWLVFLACSLPLLAQAADEGRVSFLEQEVRNLQRQVQALSRQVDQLSNRPERITPRTPSASPGTPPASEAWISAAKWQKVRAGMSELEVVEVLGTPTSMREENGARVLLYAKEIGTSGFLGGSITLRDRAVVEIRKPELQ